MSDRGEFIREFLADEIVNYLDYIGQQAWSNLTHALRQTFGFGNNHYQPVAENGQKPSPTSWQHISNIIQTLQQTKGYDPLKLIPVVTTILQSKETHKLGQRIAEGLAEKATVRLIRALLLTNNSNNRGHHLANPHYNNGRSPNPEKTPQQENNKIPHPTEK